MTHDLATIPLTGALDETPFCVKCNRIVESVTTETISETLDLPPQFGRDMWVHHTGEIIKTIRCHGEEFKISNYRGVLSRVTDDD